MRYRSEQDEQDFSYEKEEGPMIASKKEDDSDVDECSVGISISQPESIGLS